jgi:uncharacterized membrane protein YfcA
MELELLGLFALGLAIGAYGTIIGLGGGFILVPVLLVVYPDYEPEEVTSISLAVVFANSTSGSIAYARQGRIDYLTGAIFAASSAPGVVAGVFLVSVVPQRLFTLLFGLLLLGLAAVSFRGPPRAIRTPLTGPGVLRRSIVMPEGTYVFAYRVWQGALISLGVGLISSTFGIGGGAIHVPAMIMIMHFPVQFAVATSQFILVFMTGGATVIHALSGTLEGDALYRALAVGAGAVPGAQIGARIAGRIKGRTQLLLLAVALAFLSARLLVKAAFDV